MYKILELLSSGWIPVVLLLGLTACLRIRNGSWFAPSSFFGLYWVCIVAASLLAVDHSVPGIGIWVLVSLVIAVQLGSTIAETNTRSEISATEVSLRQITLRRLQKACIFFLVMAICGLIYFVWLSLDFFGQSLSVASLIQMAAKWTLLRYADFADPWPLRFAAVWIYPVALIGGLLTSVSTSRRSKLLGITSLVPALLLTFLAGGRTGFLLALGFWVGGNWAARVACAKGRLTFFRKKTILLFTCLATGLVLMFMAVNAFRGVHETSDPADLFLEYNSGQIRNYMFGTPAAFAEWFDHSTSEASSPALGGLTFQGVFDVLHLRKKVVGTYTDSESTVGQEGTNIFTMFRGLIQDFTFAGAFLVCGLWGLFSGHAYARRSLDVAPALGLAAFYAIALFSPLYSPFASNSAIFTWTVAWFVLRRRVDPSFWKEQVAAA